VSNLVLSPTHSNYRKAAQEYYHLTDEQMIGIDVHHNPSVCEGGRNIPEHLYIYHPTFHKAVHNKQARNWAAKSAGNKHGPRGKPPVKTEPTEQELRVLRYRMEGLSRAEIAELEGINEFRVKRCIRECSRFGYNAKSKTGPKKGLPQRGGVPKGTKQPNQYTL